jgi:monoamine oxidase
LPGSKTYPTKYITDLPKAEHDVEEWQAAMQVLLLVAEHDGPAMFARIGVMKALNRNFERTLTDRKEMHWGKRKLKRDELPTPAMTLQTAGAFWLGRLSGTRPIV